MVTDLHIYKPCCDWLWVTEWKVDYRYIEFCWSNICNSIHKKILQRRFFKQNGGKTKLYQTWSCYTPFIYLYFYVSTMLMMKICSDAQSSSILVFLTMWVLMKCDQALARYTLLIIRLWCDITAWSLMIENTYRSCYLHKIAIFIR